MNTAHKPLFPFDLTVGATATGVTDLVAAIIDESDRQVKEKELKEADAVDEFRMACDALNSWRMNLRFIEELGQERLDEETAKIFHDMCRRVAKKRGYTDDDFQSALLATCERTRLPWGYNSLRLAYGRAQRNPIRLLDPALADSPLVTTIAGIALYLHQMQREGDEILLPVDSVRSLLNQRKLVVGGAIMRLMHSGLIEKTSKRYGTGRAREFKFRGIEGQDYVFVNQSAEGTKDM